VNKVFDIDLIPAIEKANEIDAKIIAIQIPEGLKTKANSIIEELSSGTGAEVIVIADTCWGACDLGDMKALSVGADMLVHFGHSKMLESKLPVVYVPVHVKWEQTKFQKGISDLIEILNKEKISSVGLAASLQYLPFLERCKEILSKKGIGAIVGKGTERVKNNGQILGCNYSAAFDIADKVQGFVYFGEGMFHPIGITFSGKRVWILTPDGDVKEISEEKEKLIRKRYAAIAAAKDAKKFGIIISSKRGQLRKKKALELKKIIEEAEKEASIIVMDEIRPENLLGINADCYVITACPRIAIEEYARFDKPLLNPKELEIALGKRKEFELEEWEY